MILTLISWFQMNTGQTGGPAGVDINVLPVWKQGITGRGVVLSVLDDGMHAPLGYISSPFTIDFIVEFDLIEF